MNKEYERELRLASVRSIFYSNHWHENRPDKCDCCNLYSQKILAHHHNYNFPTDIIWLCNGCHLRLHYADRKIKNLNHRKDTLVKPSIFENQLDRGTIWILRGKSEVG